MIADWPCPGGSTEYALALHRGRASCLLVLPALFDEAGKLRHFTVETMRLLDAAGIDCVLPDLPGCNESLQPLERQTLAGWSAAAEAAAAHFGANRVLAIRGGALVATGLPGLALAPAPGASLLRGLVRARLLASAEAGLNETREGLMAQARTGGIELAGHAIGAAMLRELEQAEPAPLDAIAPAALGGPPLWLRAEPAHDPLQAEALARIVLEDFAA